MRQDNGHVMESFLASSPPPWNAGLESVSNGPGLDLSLVLTLNTLHALSNNRVSTVRHPSNTEPRPRERMTKSRGTRTTIWRWRIFRIRISRSWIAACMASLMVGRWFLFRRIWESYHKADRAVALARKRRTFPSVRCTTIPVPIPDVTRGRRQSGSSSRSSSTSSRSIEQIEQGQVALWNPIPITPHRGHARDLQHPSSSRDAVEAKAVL